MAGPTQDTTHTLTVAAPPQDLYGLVADVSRWPVIFEPSLHVEYLEHSPTEERFQLWALVAGEVTTWTSRRTLDAGALRIDFQQERSQAPVGSMSGAWTFRPLPGGRTEVVLDHTFSAADGDPATLAALTAAVDVNSHQELAALGRIAESGHPVGELVFSFEDDVVLAAAPGDIYDFVNRSDAWPDRLPHVSRVSLREDRPGIQEMEMDTVTADGSAHTTRSIRLCTAPERIIYKQLLPPALLHGHSGRWDFFAHPEGTRVRATHTVAIKPEAIAGILGPDADLAGAREYLRTALGANSRATLSHAGAHAAGTSAGNPAGNSAGNPAR